jgi:drug/metabolite transporter (DMT)-like permease
VPASALALAALAAGVHAAWNLLIAGAPDPRAAAAAALPVGVALLAPFAVVYWRVDAAAVPYIVASAALETAYFLLLTAAYTRGALSATYPLVRGSAPVLVLLVSVAFLGASLSAAAAAGVVAVAVGVTLIRGVQRDADPRAVGLALLCGATVAGYTLVDKEGLKHAGPIPYLALVLLAPAVVALLAGRRLPRASGLVAGAGMVGAYLLTLAALRLAAAAPVAAVRETSVLIAVLAAAALGRERVGRLRLAAAAAVTAGTVAIALG